MPPDGAFERSLPKQRGKLRNAAEGAMVEALRNYPRTQSRADLTVYVTYDVKAQWFDLARFCQLMPLLGVSGFVTLSLALAELLVPSGRFHRRK